MKRSKLLSASILIASVLLLSAARNARALRNPRPNKHEENSAKDTQGTQPRQPEPTVPLSLFKTTQSALADALRAIRTQEEIAEKQAIAQYEPWYAPAVLAQFGLIIVGFAYTVVAWRQLRAMTRQTKILAVAMRAQRLAAYAQEQAVEATKNAEKPYLFVETPSLSTFKRQPNQPSLAGVGIFNPSPPPPRDETYLSFQINNRGKGVAIVEQIHLKQCMTKGRYIQELPRTRMTRGENLVVHQRIIGASDFVRQSTLVPIPIRPTEFGFIEGPRYAFVGFIQYRDVFERRYRSHFCYTYEYPLLSASSEPFFYMNGERRNRIEQRK